MIFTWIRYGKPDPAGLVGITAGVSENEEKEGLDIGEHGMRAYEIIVETKAS